jgi:hypothetical protein
VKENSLPDLERRGPVRRPMVLLENSDRLLLTDPDAPVDTVA